MASVEIEEEEAGPSSGRVVKRRKSYDVDFKLSVVAFATSESKCAAAKRFKVHEKQVREWCKQEETLRTQHNTGKPQSKRLSGGGRPPILDEYDDELADWVRSERQLRHKVTRSMIREKAKQLYREKNVDATTTDLESFPATNGFLRRFMARHSFCLRRTTTQCQKMPAECADKLAGFVAYISAQRQDKQYAFSDIIGCDETAVWLDDPGPTTVETRGVKEVSIQTTGHEKMRITIMLTARADGKKMKPFVLLPRKRPIPGLEKEFAGKLNICYAGGNWMTDSLTEQYLRISIGSFSFAPRLLIWDAFRCHHSEATKKVLQSLKVDVAIVPGGTTKYVQPADVSWNHPFKLKFREYYDEWMSTAEKSFTPAGNMRAPTFNLVCKWVSDSWDTLAPELISKSFKVCGITTALDGSEDDQIHVFKPDGQCPSGLELLKEKRLKYQQNPGLVVIDHDSDDEDEQIASSNNDSDSDRSVDLNST